MPLFLVPVATGGACLGAASLAPSQKFQSSSSAGFDLQALCCGAPFPLLFYAGTALIINWPTVHLTSMSTVSLPARKQLHEVTHSCVFLLLYPQHLEWCLGHIYIKEGLGS